MFCKEDNTLYPKEQLIQNAVLRRYNDFSLSMLAWEDVLIEQKNYKALVPDLFVKEIRPNESFELLFIAKNMNDSVFLKLRNHILICEDEELKKHPLGLNNFISGLQNNHCLFPGSFLCVDVSDFLTFVNYPSKWRRNKVFN